MTTVLRIIFYFFVLQRLFLVSGRQHHCLLGARRQRYSSQGDPDAAPHQTGDPSEEFIQCGRLQAALAEERRLPVCESGQDSKRHTGEGVVATGAACKRAAASEDLLLSCVCVCAEYSCAGA